MSRIIEADFLPSPVEEAKEKPRILIVDDNRDFTYSAKLGLERTGLYSVWEENEPAKAHQIARRVKPDLILLDIAMPETDGGEVAARIESDPILHRTPVVFLTALVTKAEVRSGLQIQGHPFLAKPISIPELVTGIERYLPAHAPSIRDTNKPRILIVDDNLRFSQSARQTLQSSGHYVVCEENDAASALETARSFRPDLIVMDLVMPRLDGAQLAAQIESDWALHGVPIVFVTGLVTPAEAKNGQRIDGHHALSKPVSSSNLLRVVEESLPCRAAA